MGCILRLRNGTILLVALCSCSGVNKPIGAQETGASAADVDDDTSLPLDTAESGTPPEHIDDDGDGVSVADGDCDDSDPNVHPDAIEVCDDGLDNDCNDLADDDDPGLDWGSATTWYLDADDDGVGIEDDTVLACLAPSAYVVADPAGFDCDDDDPDFHPHASEDDCTDPADYNCDGVVGYVDEDGDGFAACEDCDDTDAALNPDANEVCDDGLDNNCNDLADDDDPGLDLTTATTWYRDADDDGVGDMSITLLACLLPEGHAAADPAGFDCDDDDPDFHPHASEDDCTDPADYNCDGVVGYADDDSDGFAACEDCDDTDAAVNPDAIEVCDDGLDNDCDALADDDDPDLDLTTATTWYLDADEDGVGTEDDSLLACVAPSAYVTADPAGFDCDGDDPDFHPHAIEDDCADPADYNCDGEVGFADEDGDGFAACEDCNDTDATVNPDATEVCDDGLDNDCNDLADDDDPDLDMATATTWYLDADDDGVGTEEDFLPACLVPEGHVAADPAGFDCDDDDPDFHPHAIEDDCSDPADYNCDGEVGFADEDGDGFAACEDCDDTDATVNPDATEVCDDGLDNDCNDLADDDDPDLDLSSAPAWFLDDDGDDFGDLEYPAWSCMAPEDYVADDTDCDDLRDDVYPGAPEVCDEAHTDEDCDGAADDLDTEGAMGRTLAHVDADGDHFGDALDAGTLFCDIPVTHVLDDTDCDDSAPAVHPDAAEICDDLDTDEDCDGAADDLDEGGAGGKSTRYPDTDGDGFGDAGHSGTAYCDPPEGWVADHNDCDDGDSSEHPDADERCDGDDDDCDGAIDEDDAVDALTWYIDYDGDGYGSSAFTRRSCESLEGYVANDTDCDDIDAAIHPEATEICDEANTDEDCDGGADDADSDGASGKSTRYPDSDGDGYGNRDHGGTEYCDWPAGWVTDHTDCNDSAGGINPGAAEVCDGSNTDEDCDGAADDADSGGASGKSTRYPDSDGDGFGDLSHGGTAYCDPPSGWVTDHTDCSDSESYVSPGATEICDAIDDDCNGLIDEGISGCSCAGTGCTQTFAASGTFTVPPWLTEVTVTVVGGGGGGGGGTAKYSYDCCPNPGDGGSGGSSSFGSYVVASGGAGGIARGMSDNDGSPGGDSYGPGGAGGIQPEPTPTLFCHAPIDATGGSQGGGGGGGYGKCPTWATGGGRGGTGGGGGTQILSSTVTGLTGGEAVPITVGGGGSGGHRGGHTNGYTIIYGGNGASGGAGLVFVTVDVGP